MKSKLSIAFLLVSVFGFTKSDKEPKPTPAPTLPVGVYQEKK